MKDSIAISLFVLIVAIAFTCALGYVFNIIAFLECDFSAPYKAEAIRAIGILLPFVGAIAGFCKIGV